MEFGTLHACTPLASLWLRSQMKDGWPIAALIVWAPILMSLLGLELHGLDLGHVVYNRSACRHPESQNYGCLLTR